VSDPRVFANTAAAVSEARHYVIDELADVPRAVVDAVAVMVSELVTNCVRHTGTEFTVTVDRDRRRIRIEVTDRGSGLPTVRLPPATEPTGRGLRIVQELSDSFGVRQLADGPGKTVWFVVDLDARAPGSSVAGGDARDSRRA